MNIHSDQLEVREGRSYLDAENRTVQIMDNHCEIPDKQFPLLGRFSDFSFAGWYSKSGKHGCGSITRSLVSIVESNVNVSKSPKLRKVGKEMSDIVKVNLDCDGAVRSNDVRSRAGIQRIEMGLKRLEESLAKKKKSLFPWFLLYSLPAQAVVNPFLNMGLMDSGLDAMSADMAANMSSGALAAVTVANAAYLMFTRAKEKAKEVSEL